MYSTNVPSSDFDIDHNRNGKCYAAFPSDETYKFIYEKKMLLKKGETFTGTIYHHAYGGSGRQSAMVGIALNGTGCSAHRDFASSGSRNYYSNAACSYIAEEDTELNVMLCAHRFSTTTRFLFGSIIVN